MTNEEQEILDCPKCDNRGWFIVTGRDGEPEQVQCEWCDTIPNSRFNYERTVQGLT